MGSEKKELYYLLSALVEFCESHEIQEAIDGSNDPSIFCERAVKMIENRFGKHWRRYDGWYAYEA